MKLLSFIITPAYIFILFNFLLFQFPQSVQSIALSRLCGSFGHSCFGGNWGKRALSLGSPLRFNTNNDKKIISSTINDNDISEKLRVKLFKQRLQQLFGFE